MKKKGFVRARVNVKVTPGEMLRALRELKGLSQNRLAELTGMSQSNISAIENGARHIGRERAIVLAKALKVHPAVILFPDFDIRDVA
jgi:transcriptional regulator with XRE-family HTH domain